MSNVFFSPESLPYLGQILSAVLHACTQVPDTNVVKSTFIVLRQLSDQWLGDQPVQAGGGEFFLLLFIAIAWDYLFFFFLHLPFHCWTFLFAITFFFSDSYFFIFLLLLLLLFLLLLPSIFFFFSSFERLDTLRCETNVVVLASQ
jgi:hypothetical protein